MSSTRLPSLSFPTKTSTKLKRPKERKETTHHSSHQPQQIILQRVPLTLRERRSSTHLLLLALPLPSPSSMMKMKMRMTIRDVTSSSSSSSLKISSFVRRVFAFPFSALEVGDAWGVGSERASEEERVERGKRAREGGEKSREEEEERGDEIQVESSRKDAKEESNIRNAETQDSLDFGNSGSSTAPLAELLPVTLPR